MGGGSSFTTDDWLNLNPLASASGEFTDTRESRMAATATQEADAAEVTPKTTTTGVSSVVGEVGGSAGEDIPSAEAARKKRKQRAGTTSAQIPSNTGIETGTGVGLGGV